MKTVGIIGYGHFGQFLVDKLSPYFAVKVFSASGKTSQWSTTLEDVAKSDYVVLSLPLTEHAAICEQLKPLITPETIIVDVCSIKEESGTIIRNRLPDQLLLSTHPLFGPESASVSLEGHTIVVCDDMTTEELVAPSVAFFESLGLNVEVMSSVEHDKSMALVQGLTFFVARVLKEFNLHDSKLRTPSYAKLMALAELEKQHTKELFVTIQNGNPHVNALRESFIERAQNMQSQLAAKQAPKE